MPQHESTEQTLHFLIPQSLHRRKFKIKLRRTQNRRVLACHQTQKISGNTALDQDVLLLLSILEQFVIRYSFSKSGIILLIHETGINTIPNHGEQNINLRIHSQHQTIDLVYFQNGNTAAHQQGLPTALMSTPPFAAENCTICHDRLSAKQNKKLPCNHLFHAEVSVVVIL